MDGQECDPNIFLKMVNMAGGPAHDATIWLAIWNSEILLVYLALNQLALSEKIGMPLC